ncbi:MAG: hypothetical protein ACI8W8_001852 [Rhodothermales bacterium]|jgi:hypothetical protein
MPEETDPIARTLAGVKTIYQQVDDLKRLLGNYFQDPTQAGSEHRPIPFSVYRANRDQSKGVALRIEPKSDDRGRCLFAEMAGQRTALGKQGSATFDWPEALRVSLGRPDVSQIVAYIDKRLANNNEKYNCYDLYHDSSMYAGKKQNSIVSIGWSTRGDAETLRLQISRQSGVDCRRMAVNMSFHEAYELQLLLSDWLVARYNWSGRSLAGGPEPSSS